MKILRHGFVLNQKSAPRAQRRKAALQKQFEAKRAEIETLRGQYTPKARGGGQSSLISGIYRSNAVAPWNTSIGRRNSFRKAEAQAKRARKKKHPPARKADRQAERNFDKTRYHSTPPGIPRAGASKETHGPVKIIYSRDLGIDNRKTEASPAASRAPGPGAKLAGHPNGVGTCGDRRLVDDNPATPEQNVEKLDGIV